MSGSVSWLGLLDGPDGVPQRRPGDQRSPDSPSTTDDGGRKPKIVLPEIQGGPIVLRWLQRLRFPSTQGIDDPDPEFPTEFPGIPFFVPGVGVAAPRTTP